MRFATSLILIVVGYFIFHYIKRMLKEEIYRRSGRGGWQDHNRDNVTTEEECRRILGVTDKDSPAAIRKKYKDLLAKYHPDKVQHLGIEFQEIAERKTKAIIQAYEFFRNK